MSRLLILTTVLIALSGCGKKVVVTVPLPDTNPNPQTSNGLTGDELSLWYHLSQGSELYPYRFFKALYLVDEQKPFSENLQLYGFIPDAISSSNPEGMPIGVTVAETKDLSFAGIRMIGINCAACHTTVLEKDGKAVVKIDGGRNLFDIEGFLGALAINTEKTFTNPGELLRFTNRLLVDLAEDALPNSLLTRIIPKGGEKLLAKMGTLDDFENRGPVEKQLVADVRKMIDEELKKPIKRIQETLKTKSDNALLKEYSTRFKHGSTQLKFNDPAGIVKASEALREQIHGKIETGLQDFKNLSAVVPGLNSPLHSLNEVARQAELAAGFTNIKKTFDLLRARAQFIASLAKQNPGYTPSLPGRVDAFGSARNAMFPDTPVIKNAPVGYPHLWNIKETPWYHYDNNTTSELERNVGEAIGVGVIYSKDYDSTVSIDNILELERLAGKLTPPVWPETVFGKIDQEKAARGKVLYQKYNCGKCHQDVVSGEKFKDVMNTLDEIGTDPLRATNFALSMGNGQFVDGLSPLLKNIIRANGGTTNDGNNWRTTGQYGARPLNSIWASPPYLHNGSVPSIYQLLLPQEDRSKHFKVGIREFDPVKLGYKIEGSSSLAKNFDVITVKETPIKGNSNAGHSGPTFGTDMTDEQRYDLIEYLKTK